MSSITFKKGVLASTIAMVLAGGATPFAIAAEEAADQKTEVIEVRGIRGSLKENINAKRFADSVVDIITAEDIGKFPDKNVAETLSRITGVAVSREFGEGEKISIRGAGPKYNRTLLNGQTVGTADWFILDEANRSFNYTMLPSVIVKGLEVHKSPTASLEEGSLGGTVILQTRRPLDMDANTVSLSAEAQYSDQSGETDPQLAGMYSWKNEDENFGFMVSAVQQDRTLERQGLEILAWDEGDDGYSIPRNIGAPRFLQDRERSTYFATLQYAPTDDLVMTFNALSSKMDVDNQNANLLNFPTANRAEAIANATNVVNGAILATSDDDGRAAYNFINRVSSTETKQFHLDVDYTTDSYTLNFEIGTTKAEGGTLRETSWEYNAMTAGYDYDLTGTPTVDFGVEPSDGENFTAGWIWGGSKPGTDEEDFVQLDLTLPVDFGVFTEIKTGIKSRSAERTQGRHAYSWHASQDVDPNSDWNGTMWTIFENCPTLADCGLDALGAVNVDVAAGGNITSQLAHNRAVMEEMAFGPGSAYAIHDNLGEIWAVEEDILSLYVQGDFSGDGFRGNVGVRYVSTEQTSSGYNYSQDSSGLKTLNGNWLNPSELEWVSQENDYSEFLPSFNIALDIAEDQIFRIGAARVMSRQNWQDISGNESMGSLSTTQKNTGTRGNPQLRPTIANQFDMSYEWYYSDASMFAATYFVKDINTLRTSSVDIQDRYYEQEQAWVPVEFTQPGNGYGGLIDGLEFSIQHDFGGYGITANYTYTNTSTDEERDPAKVGSGLIEGTSQDMLNLSAYYENDTFGARIMYNYRSEWYKGQHFNGDELYNDDFGQWDASANWNYNENVTFTLEAVNLSDEEIVEYNIDKVRVMSIYANGRRFVAGVRVNF
ncbi:TonB-dependent receptor [Thalassotalea profundi]|uniref:TonB-dependent receptor n=1 Tax=Thalassotalea profundi TaxID=2036687 RepID=A0ABQ3IUX3_9GAMM|nr:TonB-dependent receptor [Thalassotalea profundi]GHE95355.1 TonB-dependent receptor [Thalassotalea profundi]